MQRSHFSSHRANKPPKISLKRGLERTVWIIAVSLLWIYASPVL